MSAASDRTSAEWQRALLLLPEMELRELLADAVSFTTALSASHLDAHIHCPWTVRRRVETTFP